MGAGGMVTLGSVRGPELFRPFTAARAAVVAGVAMGIAGALTGLIAYQVSQREHPRGVLVEQLDIGDGLAHLRVARNPVLVEPHEFESDGEASYRYSRPSWGWLGWLFSGGSDDRAPAAFIPLSILGAGALAFTLAQRIGWLALGMFVLPGLLSAVVWMGPEPLGAALVVAGLGAWWWLLPVGLFRETQLLVPFVLFLRRRDVRTIAPFAVLGVWVTYLVVRLGAFPSGENVVALWYGSSSGRGLGPPLFGILRSVGDWGGAEYATIVVLIVSLVAATAVPETRPFGLAFGVLALVLGWEVWQVWAHVARVLLPLQVFGLLAIGVILRRRISPAQQA